MTHARWDASRVRSYEYIQLFGIGPINANLNKSFFYGYARGLQYSGMGEGITNAVESAAQSDCFYAFYGMVDTLDLMAHDFKNILGEGQLGWFNVIAYDPLHFSGDLSISYQYCGGN